MTATFHVGDVFEHNPPVLAINKWATNADLISDAARLGYLNGNVLDATYGYGTFWQKFTPATLIAGDNNQAKAPDVVLDFTELPFPDRTFDNVVLDPPYKLNGNPSDTDGSDERYGVEVYTDWRARMTLIRYGITECSRVLGGGYLLLKCQDQVCSGRVRWQTVDFTARPADCGLGLVDRFDFLSYRAQPAGRRQVHARRNASTLLVFKRGWKS